MKFNAAACAALLLAATFGICAGAQETTGAKLVDAKPGDVRVFATAAFRVPLDAVLARAAQAIGHPIVVEYGQTRGNLRDAILAGQEFELAILLPDANADLAKQGKLLPGSYVIGLDPTGLSLRGSVASPPDVSTPAALKQALLKAKSVKYGPTGAAIDTVKKVLGTLGIADSIKDMSRSREPVVLAPGEYELTFGPISEIIPNKAVVNLGPVIPELQAPAVIAAAIGAHARDPKAAHELIRFLRGPETRAAYEADGMLKPKGKAT
jgi:molybdate transport system substrate-binding protein